MTPAGGTGASPTPDSPWVSIATARDRLSGRRAPMAIGKRLPALRSISTQFLYAFSITVLPYVTESPRTSNSGDAIASSRARVSSMPGSVSRMTGCGKRDAGGVDSGTAIRLGRANLLRNHIVQLLELGGAAEAEDALDDPSPPVEQHGVGQAAIVIGRLHPSTAHEDRERRAGQRDERAQPPPPHLL